MPGMQTLLTGVKNHVFKNKKVYVTYGFMDKDYGGSHFGTDLTAGKGVLDFVIADEDGVIEYVKTSVKSSVDKINHPDALGNNIKLRHADNDMSRYCHLKHGTITVKVGDFVKKGDVLGYVGNTGFSLAPHLHFERWVNGKRVDPLPYIKGEKLYNVTNFNVITELYTVNASALNVRAKPNLSSPVITAPLLNGQKINCFKGSEVNSDGYTWIKIKLSGKEAYCAKNYLSKI